MNPPDASLSAPPRHILVMGASGRVGRGLRRAWRCAPPDGITPLWQVRSGTGASDDLIWPPLDAPAPRLPPLLAVIVLSGVTPTTGKGDLAENSALALAGLQVAEAANARHVFLSSSQAIYSRLDHPADEQAPIAPPNAYGAAKAAMERAAHDWQNAVPNRPAITSLRIGNVAGTDALGLNAAQGVPLILDRFDNGEGPERSYIGVKTFAGVLAALLAHVARGTDLPFALNVAAPHPVAMADLLSAWDRHWTWRPAPPDARQSVTLDVSCLSRLYNFDPSDSDPAEMAKQCQE